MFAVPGLLALIFVEYVRPQEYVASLRGIPLLHSAVALAVLGFVVDLRVGLSRLRAVPHLGLAAALFAWALVTLAIRAPDQLVPSFTMVAIPFAMFVVIAHGVQSFRLLAVMCGLLLAICLALAAIGIEQGLAPYGCHRATIGDGGVTLVYDGRPCSEADRNVCELEDAEPGAEYVCEKVGLFGTQSDHGRARYRGTLQDPNELSLALGIALPFAFAFVERRRSAARFLLVVASCVAVGLCAYFTQSRGGQLVFLTVLAVYFVRRFGLRRGLITGTVLALPLLVLGGRAGAESSTMERLECWWVGLHLVAASPGFGVGFNQFTEHHYLTAHNSVVLTAAELGIVGVVLWTSTVYMAMKIAVRVLQSAAPPVAQAWATALLASIAGLAVGSFFLSYAYKDVCWIYLGLSGVLYQAVRRHDPEFEVRFTIRDLGLVVAIDLALLTSLVGYTGVKLGW